MSTGSTGGLSPTRPLVLGIVSLVLTLVVLALAIANPVWYRWLSVVAGLCTTATFYSTYRQRRTP